MSEALPNEELTPSALNDKIESVKTELTKEISELQAQIVALGKRSDSNDLKQNSQIVRVAMLIDTAMDNLHNCAGIINEMNAKLSDQDKQLITHGSSISINKRNVTELSKYVKNMREVLNECVDGLSKVEQNQGKILDTRDVVLVSGGLVLAGVIWLCTGDHATFFWNALTNLFS